MPNFTELCKGISLRLRTHREYLGWTRAELARVIEKSERTISTYEAESSSLIPTDALVRLAYHEDWGKGAVKKILDMADVKEFNGFRYHRRLPDRLDDSDDSGERADDQEEREKKRLSLVQQNQKQEFQLGIDIFEKLFEQGRSVRSLKQQDSVDMDRVYTALRSVFVNHVVQFSTVKQAEDLAEKVKRAYGLENVLVADVSTPPDSDVRYFDGTPLRVELVSSLVAHEVFSCLDDPKSALLGGGYTVMRMLNNSLASATQFAGTSWIPAVSYPREKGRAADFLITPHYSANYLATYLAGRFGRSEAIWFPYIKPNETPNERDRAAMEEAMSLAKATRYAFISVMGVGRMDGSGTIYKAHDGLGADLRSYGQLKTVIDKLDALGLLPNFAGEIIGYFLDDDGNALAIPPEVEAAIEEMGTRIPLQTLKDVATNGAVWLIAARLYKARAVRMAILNQLARSIVIDSEIAQWLLDNPPQKSAK